MSKALVIAEKPDAARNYVDVLKKKGAFQKKNGYFESNAYIVTYGFGHLLDSKDPREYPEFTSKPNNGWSWEAIPFYPPNGKLDYYLPNKPELKYRKDQLKVIKELLSRKDLSLVINACDAGREGDLIFWEIYDYFKSKLPVKRLWISSFTEEEIQKGFNNLKEASFFEPRRQAAYARQYADWFLGHNLTTGFTIKVNAPGRAIHVGRVQTPTLALLVKRREEIENFVPKDYFVIDATFGDKYKGTWFKDQLSNIRFDKKEEADAVVAKITGKTGTVVKKDVKKETVKAKPLFNLNDLQREGNKKFGFSAQKVLDLAQILYEKYKILSYPRTDSRHLGETHIPELEPTLKAIKIPDYDNFVDTILAKGIKTSKDFIDDAKVSDHHAIIPTKLKPDLSKITDETNKGVVLHTRVEILKIYDLVVRRFLSIFYPPAIYEKTEIVTEVEQETFKTSGKIMVDAGWEEVYGKEVEEDNEDESKQGLLPPIDKGEVNSVTDVKMTPKKTQPPKHYTEADLLAIMEAPKRLLDDKELQDALTETGAGLGTPATRAQTIEGLVRRKYVVKKGKQLIATDDGVNLIKVAPEELKSPEITADWEQKLLHIQEEKMGRVEFEEGISQFVVGNLERLKKATINVVFASGRTSVGVCPNCNRGIIEFPKGFACESTTREQTCFRMWKQIGGKSLTVTHLKQLLTKGETNLIKGFKSKSGSKFDAKIKFTEDKNGSVMFHFPNAPEPKSTSFLCPKCQKGIIDKGKYYACESHTKESPCFTLSKTIASKTLAETDFKELFEKGKTKLIKGFKGKNGKPFDAMLKLDNLKLEFEFPKIVQKDTGMKCPSCGSEVRESEKAFGCSNYRQCKFSIWKVMSGRVMTEDVVKELIEHKKTLNKLDGFISNKTKKSFSAYLVVNEKDGSVTFSFN